MIRERLRVFKHALPRPGSAGQGIFAVFKCKMPTATKIMNVTTVISTLNREITVKAGNTLMIFAKTAPAPMETKIAGSAQHSKVDDELSKAKKFTIGL